MGRSAMSLRDDHAVIEATLGLPRGYVHAVERRANRDYAIAVNPRRLTRAIRDDACSYGDVRAIFGRRVLRLSARTVHGRARRWRSRNRRLWWWALGHVPASPAAEPERLERDDHMLDQLRAALIRASHVGEALRQQRSRLAAEHDEEAA